ncbi:double-strand-break repair protein rad21-like protein 1 [Diaphorina citri]|uniref:Double-strand-break repair protein rad21-like protein 1 n=1 Tax=Diaphorina citri TaxID=121845 RepID=A0A3Q0II07_DIACI|nr:double-strand-break repair protein rad21-like protein 1 [Diaphorina citri]
MSFHPDTILSKNGPLWSVWRAAHLISNVKKFEVMKVDIEETLDMLNIARRTLPLRTSAHLLLGAVRLHQRQVSYLLTDCESTVAALIHSTRPEFLCVVWSPVSYTAPAHFRTFAPRRGPSSSAPGQLPVDRLRVDRCRSHPLYPPGTFVFAQYSYKR